MAVQCNINQRVRRNGLGFRVYGAWFPEAKQLAARNPGKTANVLAGSVDVECLVRGGGAFGCERSTIASVF